MSKLSQYEIARKHNLSVEMYMAVCLIAQEQESKGIIHGRTISALRRRRLLDSDRQLTQSGWDFYLEFTAAGLCMTAQIEGMQSRNPQILYERAKPRLLADQRARKSTKAAMKMAFDSDALSEASPKMVFSLLEKEERDSLGVKLMNDEEKLALVKCLLSQRRKVECRFYVVEEVRYGGRLIVLDDDSRWEVDDVDITKSRHWVASDRVLLVDGTLIRLDQTKSVSVKNENAS